jgi:hypothetical protein
MFTAVNMWSARAAKANRASKAPPTIRARKDKQEFLTGVLLYQLKVRFRHSTGIERSEIAASFFLSRRRSSASG